MLLCFGATLVYTGGMFLNDAFDAEFDWQHRRERPIPSGKITLDEVWRWSFGLLSVGTLVLMSLGNTPAIMAVALVASVVLYDAIHKLVAFSPVLMSACRYFLYLVAAAAATDGVTGLAVWSAFALAAYIIGLSYVARRESGPGTLQFWPLLFLVVPIGLAWVVNPGPGLKDAMLLGAILIFWMARCLRTTFSRSERNLGRTVSGLLAGIALVDFLAVADAPRALGMVFVCLFVSALLFQRLVPAT